MLVMLALLVCSTATRASPVLERAARTPSLLSADAIAAFTPFSYYATAAYCTPTSLLAWDCGANCEENPGFQPVAAGGDGNGIPHWYVGYDPKHKAVIVGHEGTNFNKTPEVLEDFEFLPLPLNPILFPGLSLPIAAHSGFLITHSLSAVRKTMSLYGSTSVITVGHSLGAALSLLDAVYLPLHLPSTTSFRSYLYGLPRVGNPLFAAYVDSAASRTNVTHVNNMRDPVPILPPRILGFTHPSGEIHIQAPGQWYICPGEDNGASTCEVGDASLLAFNASDHTGPYGPVEMGADTCNLNQ